MTPYFSATERCRCGATITVNAYTSDRLDEALSRWRAEHQHTVPVTVKS